LNSTLAVILIGALFFATLLMRVAILLILRSGETRAPRRTPPPTVIKDRPNHAENKP